MRVRILSSLAVGLGPLALTSSCLFPSLDGLIGPVDPSDPDWEGSSGDASTGMGGSSHTDASASGSAGSAASTQSSGGTGSLPAANGPGGTDASMGSSDTGGALNGAGGANGAGRNDNDAAGPTGAGGNTSGGGAANGTGGSSVSCAEANLDTSALHCGRCNHSCGEGICSKGVCQPYLVAFGDLMVAGLNADATALYVANQQVKPRVGAILRVPLHPLANPETIAPVQPNPFSVLSHRGRLYWTCRGQYQTDDYAIKPNTGSVVSANSDGSDRVTISEELNVPMYMAAHEDRLYWTVFGENPSGGPASGDVYACTLPACSDASPIATGQAGPTFVTADDDRVCWVTKGDPSLALTTQAGQIWCREGTKAPRLLLEEKVTSLRLAPGEQALYYTLHLGRNMLGRHSFASPVGERTLALSAMQEPETLLLDDDTFAWINYATLVNLVRVGSGIGMLPRVAFAANDATQAVRHVVDDLYPPNGAITSFAIASDATTIYFALDEGGNVGRRVMGVSK